MPPPDAAASIDAGSQQYHHSAAIADKFGQAAWYASKSFWVAVGKYGIATPLVVWGFWWGLNGITRIVEWTGNKVVEPVVTNHTVFLEKTTINQETANKTLADIGSTLKETKAEAETANIERRKLRIVLERLDRHLESIGAHRPQSDDQGNAGTQSDLGPPGLDHPCD